MNALAAKPVKPLGGKAYGSIGHLPSSRIGPGDHFVHAGQQAICTEKPRKGDRIVVTEKLDGACMSVANIDGELIALSRAGYRARDALYEHLNLFEFYLADNRAKFTDLVRPGERVAGEWLAMAHGTIYEPRHAFFEPFIAFDIFRDGARILTDEFRDRCAAAEVRRAFCIHDSGEPLSVASAIEQLSQPDIAFAGDTVGFHGSREPVEGAVWRVEREGRVDFLAKYVRHDKVDGKYLSNISGRDPIWFWRPPASSEAA